MPDLFYRKKVAQSFDAIIRYCTDIERNRYLNPKVARRVVHQPEHAGYEGVQFNYVVTFNGVQIRKRMNPVVVDRQGTYDSDLSQLVFTLPADESMEATFNPSFPISVLTHLEKRSQTIMIEIAEQEIERISELNVQDCAQMKKRLMRLCDYRVRNQQTELTQRQTRLQEAREKGQRRVIPAWEGQVRATQERIHELEQHRDDELAALDARKTVDLSIDLLNVAYVRVV